MKHFSILASLAALLLCMSCADANRQYVRKAVRIMDKQGLFAEGAEWKSARADATSEWPVPTVVVAEGGVPVVTLPPFSGNTSEGVKYALAVLSAIPEDIPGVVIDLRGNTGGNMYPMIAAVHRFLPADGETLRFRTRGKTQWIPLAYAVQVADVALQPRITCPVAILTDDHTASSGEATLICFRGLDYVRIFGAHRGVRIGQPALCPAPR
ncbi:MAG: hypothetical protein IJT74_03015 [Bacteroidales bacterium]|nr:hypothetical protein [Bacteroidales bacterium]